MAKKRLIEGISFDNDLINGIEFDETQEYTIQSIDYIKNNLMKDNTHPRIGLPSSNSDGVEMEIIGYYNKRNIIVQMRSYINNNPMYYINHNARYDHFRDGAMKSPYELSIYGIGYTGDGKYNYTDHNEYAKAHQGMIRRCYSGEEKFKNYHDVEVDPMWYNFQNFAEWCNYNYYEIDNDKMCLDKDLLLRGNKLYSPLTCIFLPNKINTLFQPNGGKNKKTDLPRGVTYKPENKSNKFKSTCSIGDGIVKNDVHLGYFPTAEEAFIVHKTYKESVIKKIADDYWFNKGGMYIPQFKRVYDAMYAWTVDIND